MTVTNLIGKQYRTFWLHIASWLLLGALNMMLFNWFVHSNQLLLRNLFHLAILAILFYVNALVLVNRFLEKRQYFTYFLLATFMVLAFVALRVKFNLSFPNISSEGFEVSKSAQQKGFILGALATNAGIVLLSTIYQTLLNRYAEERRNQAIAHRQNEAQLQFLRAQINPHFLFNTLNNIYSLAVVGSPKTADMVLKLSQLLRYVIYESREERASLEREIAHIREFIELFKMRSEEPPDIEFTSRGNLSPVQIEPMILIPIIENCFKHCDFDTNEKAFVKIHLEVRNGELTFKTINTKNNSDLQKDKTGGVGLENIRKRLELGNPGGFLLETEDKSTTFEVFFLLKLNHENNQDPAGR